MIIRTSRLVLRAVEETDNPMLLEIINDPDTEYMLGGWSFPVSSRDQSAWFAALKNTPNTLRLVAEKCGEGGTIGTVILTDIDYKNGTSEIHVKLSVEGVRGQGYGTEIVEAIVNYAFSELRLKCIYAHIIAINSASCHMFEKCGFVREGILRRRVYKRGEYIDVYSYSILQEEFNLVDR